MTAAAAYTAPVPAEPRALLLAVARDPLAPETLALAAGIGITWGWPLGPVRGGVLGLTAAASSALFAQYFPGASGLLAATHSPSAPAVEDPRSDEFADLLELLLAHRQDDSAQTEWIARAVAAACLGDNHLWEDLALPDRASLSALLGAYFPALVMQNTHNLRWKRFFYRQLCERAEVSLCKAPSCGVCSDYAACFGGGEEVAPAPALRASTERNPG